MLPPKQTLKSQSTAHAPKVVAQFSQFSIVGTDASAKGLRAIARRVSVLSGNSVGLASIEHPNSTQDSMPRQISSRNKQIMVGEATDQIAVALNHVYIIPANTDFSIQHGVLRIHRELETFNDEPQNRRAEPSQGTSGFKNVSDSIDLRSAFEQVPVGMALIDRGGWWIQVNEKLCAIIGYSREELLARKVGDVIYPDDFPIHSQEPIHGQEMDRLLSGAHRTDWREGRYIRKDGTTVWVESAVMPMRGAAPDSDYSILVMADIGERKYAQQKLGELLALEQQARRDAEQARAAAEAAVRAKDSFLAMASHELRSPLQGIVGRVEIIRSGVDPRQLEQDLIAIDRAVAKQVRSVNDLLDISSIVSGKTQVEHRPVNAARVARRAVQAAMAKAREKRQELIANVGDFGNVLGDEARLEQVFRNLLANAIEFTPPGGIIRMQCTSADGQFELRVEDNGEELAASKVSDRCSQADPTFARRHGGVRLGLAIARTLVELHGGTIEAASSGNKGTAITVRLPLSFTRESRQALHNRNGRD